MAERDRYDYYPPADSRGPPMQPEYDGGWHEPEPQPPPPNRPPPQGPPPQGPPPRSPPRRGGDLMSPKIGGIIVLVGVLLFFVGTIILQTTWLVEPPKEPDRPDSDDYDDYDDYLSALERYGNEMDDYENEVEDYQDGIRSTIGIGKILNWVGAMIIVLPLFLIGIANEKVDWKVKASMLSTATAIVITTIIVTMFYSIGPPIS